MQFSRVLFSLCEDCYLHFFTFPSRLHLFLDPFQIQSVFSLSLMLHSLENLVIARCFPTFSAHLAKFLQIKFCESVQFANIAKILPCENSRSTVV